MKMPVQHVINDLQPMPDGPLWEEELFLPAGNLVILNNFSLNNSALPNMDIQILGPGSVINQGTNFDSILTLAIQSPERIPPSYTISGSFSCSSSNIIYDNGSQQCPSTLYIGQVGYSLSERINGHIDIKNHNNSVGEYFNLPRHSIADLPGSSPTGIFKKKVQYAELEFINMLRTITPPPD